MTCTNITSLTTKVSWVESKKHLLKKIKLIKLDWITLNKKKTCFIGLVVWFISLILKRASNNL